MTALALGSHTHSVLRVDGGSVVDQVLHTVEVSRPHRNMQRGTLQLDTVEKKYYRVICEL